MMKNFPGAPVVAVGGGKRHPERKARGRPYSLQETPCEAGTAGNQHVGVGAGGSHSRAACNPRRAGAGNHRKPPAAAGTRWGPDRQAACRPPPPCCSPCRNQRRRRRPPRRRSRRRPWTVCGGSSRSSGRRNSR